jgi:hypothetical protein
MLTNATNLAKLFAALLAYGRWTSLELRMILSFAEIPSDS